MKKLVVKCADDLNVVFDEFSDEYEEYKDEYWHFFNAEVFEEEWGSRYLVRICDKCKAKYGDALELAGCTIDDFGSGCCSVDGCEETWEDKETETFYVYIPSKSAEVVEFPDEPVNQYEKRKEEVRAEAVYWFFNAPISYQYMVGYEEKREEIAKLAKRYGLLREFRENGIIQ